MPLWSPCSPPLMSLFFLSGLPRLLLAWLGDAELTALLLLLTL